MKRLVAFTLTALVGWSAFGQAKELSDPTPNFSALIVKDIDVSLAWYTDMLGYTILDQKDVKEMNFRQANLKRGSSAIELIELGKAIDPAAVIEGYSEKTKIQGIFKIGFTVSDFDDWISHLETSNAEFHGSVVSDPVSGKRMVIIKDPDGNRVQLFEN